MKYKQKRNEKKRGKDGGVALSTDIISFPFDSLSLSLSLQVLFFGWRYKFCHWRVRLVLGEVSFLLFHASYVLAFIVGPSHCAPLISSSQSLQPLQILCLPHRPPTPSYSSYQYYLCPYHLPLHLLPIYQAYIQYYHFIYHGCPSSIPFKCSPFKQVCILSLSLSLLSLANISLTLSFSLWLPICRNGQEGHDYSLQPQPGGFLDQSHMLFNNGGTLFFLSFFITQLNYSRLCHWNGLTLKFEFW